MDALYPSTELVGLVNSPAAHVALAVSEIPEPSITTTQKAGVRRYSTGGVMLALSFTSGQTQSSVRFNLKFENRREMAGICNSVEKFL